MSKTLSHRNFLLMLPIMSLLTACEAVDEPQRPAGVSAAAVWAGGG